MAPRPLPKQLALPSNLLKEIGASEPQSASRSQGRWKSQDKNRKDRRKAERHAKKQRITAPRREVHEYAKNDESVKDNSERRTAPRAAAKSAQNKRKRESVDEDEDEEDDENEDDDDDEGDEGDEGDEDHEDHEGEPLASKQPSRAVRDRLAKDDAEIEQLERKLGLKKGRKSLPKAFKDDGLDDLLGGLSDGSDSEEGTGRNEAKEWLAQKRRKATGARAEAEHDSESDEDEDEEGEDGEEDGDDGLDDDDSFGGFDSDTDETAQAPKRVRENPYLPPVSAGAQLPKYVPPSLRAKAGGDADVEAQIRRKLQGPVNRVTEANMASIVGEIEKIYREHARGHANNILTDLLMAQICDPTSKPDTLLVLSAGFVAAIYKVIGIDFAAHFLTVSVERFQEEREKANAAVKEQRIPTKETSNLITVLAEMYIFRVIGSNIMFDFVRILLGDLSELNAELLLRIVRLAGPQLRKDDPLALKDIVSLIRPAVAKIGEGNLTVRTKFMIETISDLKNNKLKAGAQDLVILNEHVTRMKKVLGSFDTQKLKATEPLRIGLKDIENADKTGKWWLVGASWAGSEAKGQRQNDSQDDGAEEADKDVDDIVIADADDLSTPDFAQLAREQGMNTDVRRAIFIALVAAADYQDAYMRVLKLRLNKFNRREVPNVLVQCSGAQQHYNPYYTLVARKFCSDSRVKYAFQDTIWTLFRRLGEPLFGEEPEEEEEEAADDRRLINTGKMIGSLVADGSVSLKILKPLNLAYVKDTTSLFVEVMLITVLQECGKAKNKTLEQALGVAFGSGLAPELARSVGYFLRKKVRNTDLLEGKKKVKKVKEACKVAEAMLQKSTLDDEL